MARQTLRTTPNHKHQPIRGADFGRTHQSVVLGEDTRDQRRGFTIVELLIVVVVIAILAAITIVAYNGINNRAKASAASSAAQQAVKKVMAFATLNADQYPTTLADAGVVNGSATYQYRVDNTTNPKTFCVTATTQNVSYFASSAQSAPAAGACPGHGADGSATITNLASMPLASLSWTHGAGTGGTAARSIQTDSRFPGSTAYQLTWSTAPTSNSSLYVSEAAAIPCEIGQQYFFSVRYASSWSGMVPGFYLSGPNTGFTAVATNRGDGTYEARGSWTATAACTSSFVPFLSLGTGTTFPTATSTLRVGAFMVVTGSTQVTYADGSSPGWAWNGAPNNSTSTGPAL